MQNVLQVAHSGLLHAEGLFALVTNGHGQA